MLCQRLKSRSTSKCLHLMSLVPLVKLGRVIHLDPPVPPVSDPPHPVAEASSGDGPPAPLPAPPYPHLALPTGHQAAYYPIGTPGPSFLGFAPPQVTLVPPASGFFPSTGPYATPVPQSVHHYWPLWQNVPSPSPPVPPVQQQPPWQPFPVPSPGHSV
uniref:Uncharacterized protein n=1 Tax=Chromera velia CCMP2878 TaxID=1169474 RepID=A0A0G4H3C9_9ALVE|eukprot:Cvel_24539.t1-p1 / transcript=Cvel_24539.t1 / gene=Cvel_24539 / organism=Chromera_velia_CCMP2878 / gene_product=hypothetical protein / transcript_product=hypothetical protein / location=Cvel_scaffold2664:21216-21686(-) / protein_length=157 / sequence_SO=supercontig / SO=protein_coding / is_pseudo=false